MSRPKGTFRSYPLLMRGLAIGQELVTPGTCSLSSPYMAAKLAGIRVSYKRVYDQGSNLAGFLVRRIA